MRHNRPGGHVAIVLDASGGRFTLTVLDDGPGVPDADLVHLGEPGWRSDDARTRAPEGRGLGLAIVGRIARAHGLELTFAAGPDGGLVASLTGLTAPGRG